MIQGFKETFISEQSLEQAVARTWGYIPAAQPYFRPKRQIKEGSLLLTTMQLRSFTPEIQKTDRIRQVEAEIRGIQNDRKLAQLNEIAARQVLLGKTGDQRSGITQMLETKIKEYNYIIDHKHLINRKSQETRRTLKLKSVDEVQRILNNIEEEKRKLYKENLGQQIATNQKIADLYKKYKWEMQRKEGRRPNSFRSRVVKESGESSSLSEPLSKTARSSDRLVNRFGKRSLLKTRAYSLSEDKQYQATLQQIQEPFAENTENYKLIENKIKSNFEVLENLKSKIMEHTPNKLMCQQNNDSRKSNNRIYIRLQNKALQRQVELEGIIRKEIPLLDFEKASSEREELDARDASTKLAKQESIVSNWLSKKHSRFGKITGTTILLKYDSEYIAKSMLVGSPPHRIAMQPPQAKMANQEEEGRLEEDDEHYWRMCKNEKMNLLFKAKK